MIDAVEAVGDGVLHVTGWEEAFGGENFKERIYDLNFLRESVVEHPATQIWWMPVAFRDVFMARAVDTWSMMKLKLMLADPKEYADLPPRIAEIIRNQLHIGSESPIPRKRVDQISYLSAFSRDLQSSDLFSLRMMRNLKTLDLSLSNVDNIKEISGLASLQMLSLLGTEVSDVAPLVNLTGLQILILANTRVKTISPLQALVNLLYLSLADTYIEDIYPLADLPIIRQIDLGRSEVKDLSPLRNLRTLDDLDLSDTLISDLSPLEALHNLNRLDLSGTPVADLSPLKDLHLLEWLGVRGTQVPAERINAFRTLRPQCKIVR